MVSSLPSIQPGGGLFFALEAAWGRLRRRWLRRFRPGYVRRMRELRQGDCPGCPHDIVDPRDLKLWRSGCGHWFRPEDDPFRWRGRLRLARAGLAEVVVASAACVAVVAPLVAAALHGGRPLLLLPAAVVAVLWFELIWFFRDPERTIPSDPSALVSPADGRVTHIEAEVHAPDFPGGRAFRISMWLSPFDVHLNRSPRSGRVLGMRYLPGRFVNARREDSARVNEQLWMDLEEPNGRRIRVKQISGALARRLVCWLRPDEQVGAGERYGMIKYGSRCDVLLPAGEAVEVLVAIGDKVHAGSTVLLRFREDHGQAHAPQS